MLAVYEGILIFINKKKILFLNNPFINYYI